ncbi:hypothetical protein [Congregibacter sp.]|jgi:hypothetical protein|uniref:hypothetical protein n=1 Tax=Congregibacter sp. TaxID=2744308 RepID=UPI0039E69F51
MMSYLQSELDVDWDRSYLSPADPRVNDEWNWSPEGRDADWEPHWVNTTHNLVSAMEANPGTQGSRRIGIL